MSVGRRGSASVALILLFLAAIGVGVVAVSAWLLPDMFRGGSEKLQPATAVVIESAQCGAPGTGDKVEVDVGGVRREAKLDGCGHSKGQRIPVQVPENPAGELVVRADSGSSGSSQGLDIGQRLDLVLITLAGLAGGGYAMMLRGRRRSRGAAS